MAVMAHAEQWPPAIPFHSYVEYAQALASLRAEGRAFRRRIESEAREPLRKLLLVEDDPLTRALLAATLAPETYELIEVARAADALAVLGEERPSLIVLDIELPDGDGIGVCEHIRRVGPARE
jgi:PleD family two-component response regulator